MTAAEKILQKALVGSGLDSRGWNSVQAGLRDAAFYSACVADGRLVRILREENARQATGAADLSKVRMGIRERLRTAGYQPTDDERNTIKDLYSKARLDVMVKTNVAKARGFIQYAKGMEPGAFAAFPAKRLLRIRQRRQGRDWAARWKAAGDFVGWEGVSRDYGQMVALKDSPIWQALGDGAGGYRDGLGAPHPPFAFGSGMGVVNVSRKEAIELGLISDEALREKTAELEKRREKGDLPSMTGRLQADVPMRHDSPEAVELQAHFPDQIRFDGDKAVWQSGAIREVVEGKRNKIRLGEATQGMLNMLRGVATPEEYAEIAKMDPSFNRRTFEDHAAKHMAGNEKRLKNNIPLLMGDYELMPSVWRLPDRIIRVKPGHFVFELESLDGGFLQFSISKEKGFTSYYKTKMPLGTAAGNAPGTP